MVSFKEYLINEARYSGHKDEGWLHDANMIADGNLKNVVRWDSPKGSEGAKAETEYWNGYKQWLQENRDTLQKLYDTMKADRNRFVEHAKELLGDKTNKVWTDATRSLQYEAWSGNVDQHDYKIYWDLISDDTKPSEHDYTIMVSNGMIDRLGGGRDLQS